MTKLQFVKHHGLGNDFLIAFFDELPEEKEAAGWARRFCHRKHGVGADGMILATVEPTVMRLWNSDGSSAEMSGNGLRCLAHAIARRKRVDQLDITISTAAGSRHCRVTAVETDSNGKTPFEVEATVIAEMGEVKVGARGPRILPGVSDPSSVIGDMAGVVVQRWGTADVGNPHIVLLVQDLYAVPLTTVGPALERLFEEGINAHFVVIAEESTMEHSVMTVRTWERGAGITEACGTGAVATASVMRNWNSIGNRVTVQMPGGNVEVNLHPATTLTGPSVYVATVTIDNIQV